MNMEMQQMLAHLLAEMKANQEKMKAEIKSYQKDMRASLKAEIKSAFEDKTDAVIAGMKDGQKETVACHEMTKARLGCKESCQTEMESEVECREVPMKEATVKSSRVVKKWHRGRHLAAECQMN
jgi:hypothetical protein